MRAEHYTRPRAETQWPVAYDPEDVRTVFGG